MCQAIPRKVLQIDGERAEVLYDGAPQWVAVRGIPDLAVDEYVVVYAGQALERMEVEEAEDILRFQEELERMLEEAAGQ
jgi:hydrogenase expression/formation protein HypC